MNELKVGLLALATMASIVFMSIKVTSNQSGFGEYVPYKTIVDDASGIFPKTSIKVAGINAGRIKSIELASDNRAVITFEILEKIKITKGSRLGIKSVGFLGDKFLEISISKNKERLKEGSILQAAEGGGLNSLVGDASNVMGDVKAVMKSLRESLAPEGEVSPIKRIMGDVEKLAENTRIATESMKRLMQGNEKRIDQIVANFESFSNDIAYQVNNKNEDSAMADIKVILANAKKMTAEMEELVAYVKSGKGTMGQFLVKDDIADEVNQTLSGVNRLFNRVDQIRTELAMFSGANSKYGSESDIAFKIFPAPDRFYMLGVNVTEFGFPQEQVIDSNISGTGLGAGTDTREVRTTKTKGGFRFNLQLGRKINDWTIRGGLIESTGGFGVDYDLSRWDTRLTAEVFDYRDKIGPNLRLSTDFQIFNVMYGKVSFEDVINKNRSATISAGLKFSDEDLKGLVAFFI